MRVVLFAVLTFVLACCSATGDLAGPVEPLGNFKMGLIVPKAAADLQKGPLSRSATAEEWESAMKTAFTARFSRFQGDRAVDIGIVIDGYVLAQVGVPVVAAPKSLVLLRIILVDSETQQVLNEPHQISAFESFSAGSVVSSGLANSRDEQLTDLANAAARATESWMRRQPWFSDGET